MVRLWHALMRSTSCRSPKREALQRRTIGERRGAPSNRDAGHKSAVKNLESFDRNAIIGGAMISKRLRGVLAALALLLAFTARFAAVPSFERLETQDLNHDGRPDVWRYFDGEGALLRQSLDTNFDGRSDVE